MGSRWIPAGSRSPSPPHCSSSTTASQPLEMCSRIDSITEGYLNSLPAQRSGAVRPGAGVVGLHGYGGLSAGHPHRRAEPGRLRRSGASL